MDTPSSSIIAAGSTIALAGIGSTALLEWLPKSAIVSIAIAALALAAFFVKRDYAKLGDFMQMSNKRQGDIEAVLRQMVTGAEHRESIAGVHRKVDTLYSANAERLLELHTRVVVVETKQGAYDVIELRKETEKE